MSCLNVILASVMLIVCQNDLILILMSRISVEILVIMLSIAVDDKFVTLVGEFICQPKLNEFNRSLNNFKQYLLLGSICK